MPTRSHSIEEDSDGSIVLSEGAREVKPHRLIAIYNIEGLNKKYIESAFVDRKGRVLSFYPLSVQQTHQFAESLLASKETRKGSALGGWTGSRILYVGVQGRDITIVWKRDPGIAEVRYAKELKISSGTIATPGMIFAYSKDTGNLFVWAYKDFDGQNTMLYHLPFHNVYENGRTCMGQSKTRFNAKDTFDSYCTRWEWLFFNTAGSEIHYTGAFPTNINTLHKELRQGAPFPTEKLVNYGKLKTHYRP
jgi:hypothetical protein